MFSQLQPLITDLGTAADRLSERRRQLLDRIDRIGADLKREREPLTPDLPDQAIQRENDDVLVSLRINAEVELRQVDEAIARVASGSYGLCRLCGKSIESSRLQAIPHALCCTRCTVLHERRASS